jgi:hypoxanthine phosphoribosyltransferase
MRGEAERIFSQAECLFTEKEIDMALDEMASQITAMLAESNPVVLCVMNGGLIVTSKLLVRLNFSLQQDYVHATRYGSELSGKELHWKAYPELSMQGRTVLIVDDILDEGETLARIRDYCLSQGAAKVMSAVLVDKQHNRRTSELPRADFTALEAPDRYLFGSGMDYKTYLRNVPGIYAVAGT